MSKNMKKRYIENTETTVAIRAKHWQRDIESTEVKISKRKKRNRKAKQSAKCKRFMKGFEESTKTYSNLPRVLRQVCEMGTFPPHLGGTNGNRKIHGAITPRQARIYASELSDAKRVVDSMKKA